MNVFEKGRLVSLLIAAGCVLTACGGDMADLDAYINEVKARPGGRIEPLPEITPYQSFAYVADVEGLRSPFAPDTPQVAQGPGGGHGALVECADGRIPHHRRPE